MGLTSIARLAFLQRQKQLEKHFTCPDKLQEKVLWHLIQRATDTQYGHDHAFGNIKNYDSFTKNIPVNTYEELKGYIDDMRHGKSDVLWPGMVKWYAKSSGTTNDKSKFIPVSKEGLQKIHYAGGTDVVVWYLQNNPKSRLFDGRALILGGSHSPNYNVAGSLVGDLSAILIENINPLVNLVRVPTKEIALTSDFEVKREKLARYCLDKNVTNLSGVPSWMMSVLQRVMELSGKQHLEEVWPNLEVFFHGGIAFTPYRKQYENLITKPDMHYMETYNASEGFFGIQNDPSDSSMMLMLDYDVYYEFAPMDAIDDSGQLTDPSKVIPLSAVEVGKNYAMIISTSCGLWRYMIGDTVKFTSTKPYKFYISGRTKSFINAFGEELIVDNVEKGLQYACQQTGAQVREYTAAPVHRALHPCPLPRGGENSTNPSEERTQTITHTTPLPREGQGGGAAVPYHQWVIEFSKEPADLEQFADILDQRLQELNSDYEAKRFKSINMIRLQIVKARPNLFDDWLKSKGKLGGQHKVPRLSNSRKIIEEILSMN